MGQLAWYFLRQRSSQLLGSCSPKPHQEMSYRELCHARSGSKHTSTPAPLSTHSQLKRNENLSEQGQHLPWTLISILKLFTPSLRGSCYLPQSPKSAHPKEGMSGRGGRRSQKVSLRTRVYDGLSSGHLPEKTGCGGLRTQARQQGPITSCLNPNPFPSPEPHQLWKSGSTLQPALALS